MYETLCDIHIYALSGRVDEAVTPVHSLCGNSADNLHCSSIFVYINLGDSSTEVSLFDVNVVTRKVVPHPPCIILDSLRRLDISNDLQVLRVVLD